ncbi:MAG: LysR family transcriptional regulator [Cyclobacteriaceae bacterium]
MNYTLHQLKVFLKIVEFQSITKASEALFLTQPAVSIQLKRLQDQFEIPLTEVIGRQLYITDFGSKIAEVSRNILREADAIKTTIDQYNGLLTGKIIVSTVSTGKYIIPYFLTGFMKKYPGVEMVVDVSNREKVLESLAGNESDFSLVSVLPENTPVNKIDLMENRLYMVASSRIHKGKLTPASLANETIILREKGSATRKAMEQYLEKYNISYKKSMVLVSNEAVKQAVLAGIGFSIMPLIGLRNEIANDSLLICPMKDLPIITSWNLIYDERKKLSPASTELISYINAHKQDVVGEYFDFDAFDS